MNVSEYYEYKKGNDEQIAEYNAQKENEKKEQKKQKTENTKEKIKGAVDTVEKVATAIPHFTKAAGIATVLGLIKKGADKAKEIF